MATTSLRKAAAFGISKGLSYSRFLLGNPQSQRLVILRPPCRGFSACSVDPIGSGLDSANKGGGGHGYQEFRRWHNGGGTVHESATVDLTALIEIGCVIHPGAGVGANVHIGSGSVIGPGVTIGKSTKIGYNVSLSNCRIGKSCMIHNGASIGQDGFGFFVDENGNMQKKPQMLSAVVGDHVEIGANACIDRGSWRDTVIGDWSKLDNLVQIGHNVVVGKNCILCGQAGVAGSVTIGDYVTLGGRAAVRDHVSIVSKVRLAANSLVTKDIREPGDYGGFPAVPIDQWRKEVASRRSQR